MYALKLIYKILQHRLFITLIVSAIIIYFIPNIFEKYIAKQKQVIISNSDQNYCFFVDIDHDGFSESYEFSHDQLGNKENFNLMSFTGGNI